MKAFKVEKDHTVHEIDVDPDTWMTADITWSATRLDERHDVWFDGDGLWQPGLVTAAIGGTVTPLPAYITGIDREDIGPAEMTLEEARALVA